MRIAISGGSGLIGKALASDLVKRGDSVSILTRKTVSQPGASVEPGLHWVQWDPAQPGTWVQGLEGFDVLVNLAGENLSAGRWSKERKARLASSRVSSGKTLVQAVKELANPPRLLLQSSAIGYYGACSDEILDENSPAGSGFLADLCQEWEASTEPVEAMGIRRAVLRTGVVLSRDGGALPLMALPHTFFAGGPQGSGAQWVSWIHIQDAAAAMRFLIDHQAASGVFNLTAPQPVTNRSFNLTLAQARRRISWLPAPAAALKLALGEMSTVILDGQRVLPRRLEQLGFKFQYATLESALKDLYR
jgi:uncharacterized protein (TIGR01777 family)